MLNSTGELEFSNEEDPEIISQLTSLALSDGKSSAGAPEKTGYPDSVYVMAANIFQGIRIEKSAQKVLIKYGNEPLRSFSESEDQSFQRLSYELAFSALKYQDILETILIDSCIFPSTTIPDHLSSLIIVMLYDFQDRKFQTRVLSDNEESISEVQEVENLLNSPEEVYNNLKRRGYNKVKSVLHIDDKVFAVDQHCYDVLIFPSHLKNDLINIDLFKDYKLIFQFSNKMFKIVAGGKKKRMTLLKEKTILKDTENRKREKLMRHEKGSRWGHIKSDSSADIEILRETFINIESKDHRLQKVKVILLLPRCSGLGVSNPVEFILNEHEDTEFLKDHSQGGISVDKLHILAQQQYEQLTHAMKFTKAQAVVYCTCSVCPEENEAVVKKALEFQDLGNKVQPYRLSPPVLPLCSLKEIQLSTDKFFRMEPSEITNGCFLSVLTRERDPSETVSVKDVLARAAAKGLLDGIELGKSSKREKKKKKSKASLTKAATADNGIQMKIAEFLNRETKASANLSETVTKPPLPQKNTAQVGASSQTRKHKLAPHPAVPTFMKNTCPSRPHERQTHFIRPRPEDRMVALKPIEIVLPPVFMPFSSPQGIRSWMPTQHLYFHWVAPKALVPTCLPTPSLSRKGEKPKDDTRSSLLRPPRRWL
ncbi:hypothetical protein H8958_000743 [Nasalis larvatus]